MIKSQTSTYSEAPHNTLTRSPFRSVTATATAATDAKNDPCNAYTLTYRAAQANSGEVPE